MNYKIIFTTQAIEDLFETYKFVALNDSLEKADMLLSQLKLKCSSLNKFPNRGHKLPELLNIGELTYLEIHYKP